MNETQTKSAEALLKLLLDECGCSIVRHDPSMSGNTIGALLIKTQTCRYNVGVTAELALALAVQRFVEAEVRRQLQANGVPPAAGDIATAANITPPPPLAEPFMVQVEHLGASVVAEADYEALRKDRDIHYARCATLIFSPAFNDVTSAEARLWLVEYEDARAKLQEAVKALGDYYITGGLRLSIENLVSGLQQELSVKMEFKNDLFSIENLLKPWLRANSHSTIGMVADVLEQMATCEKAHEALSSIVGCGSPGWTAELDQVRLAVERSKEKWIDSVAFSPELADERPLPCEVTLGEGVMLQPGAPLQLLHDILDRLISFQSVREARVAPSTVIIIDEDHARGG